MTKAGLLGAGSLALCALLAVSNTVGASAVATPHARYVEPRGTTDAGFVRVAGLFGESDEEKAARLAHEQNQDDAINRLNQKIHDLEESVRNLTGQNEDLSHRLNELDDKMARQQKDFEYRICTMAAQQLGASAGQSDPNAVPCGVTTGAAAPGPLVAGVPDGPTPQGRVTGEVGQHLAPPPGVLGTLPMGSAGNAPAPAAGGANDDTRAQFSTAMNLLAKARYEEARAAFRNFADKNPKDELAPQAVYWFADIAYVQKDYDGAVQGFIEVIQKYPNSVRAPDSMLKLAQALIASGKKKEGCTTLAALPGRYPKAPKAILAQGADARKAVCKAYT